jgi:hypothetical protein
MDSSGLKKALQNLETRNAFADSLRSTPSGDRFLNLYFDLLAYSKVCGF